MANWIYNTLWIKGPEEDINRFVAIAGTDHEASRYYPRNVKPAGVRNSKGYAGEKSDSNTEILSFGHFVKVRRVGVFRAMTAYDPLDPLVKRVQRNLVHYTFETPFSDPKFWLEYVSFLFPTLTFYNIAMWLRKRNEAHHYIFRRCVYYERINGEFKRRKFTRASFIVA